MLQINIVHTVNKLGWYLRMIGSDCSHIGNLCLVSAEQDTRVGSHENTLSSCYKIILNQNVYYPEGKKVSYFLGFTKYKSF